MDIEKKEKWILYVWGCRDYRLTLGCLAYLAALTVDTDMKRVINRLNRVLFHQRAKKLAKRRGLRCIRGGFVVKVS